MAMMLRVSSSSIAVFKACNVSASAVVVGMSRRFSSNVSASSAAANVIFKHIQELSKKSDTILRARQRLRRTKVVVNPLQRQLIQSHPRAVHQLQFLRKLYDKMAPAGQLELLHIDDSAQIARVITNELHCLQRKLDLISKSEKDHFLPGVPRGCAELEIVSAKPCVVHQLIALKTISEEIAFEIELNELKHDQGRTQDLTLRAGWSVPQPTLRSESPKGAALPWDCKCESHPPLLSIEQEEERLLDKYRYLLVSNGSEIHCLDLKQSVNPLTMTHDVPLLPIIATLNLVDKGLPIAPSLFKWRNDKVYMIGGQTLIPRVLNKDGDGGGLLEGHGLYRELCESNEVKGTSGLLGLSLDDSKTTILSRPESNVLRLKKPKIQPIVEELNGEIHVIDSPPFCLAFEKDHTWTGSHEVLNRRNGCWVEEVAGPQDGETYPILSHLVVGNKIFIKNVHVRLVLFDSRKNKWHHVGLNARGLPKDDVWWILRNSFVAGSVGGFPYGDAQDPLYVVIALIWEREDSMRFGSYAEAFLVDSSGQVVCTQSLRQLMQGVDAYDGKIIKVEEDKLGKKKTMCSIANGYPLGLGDCNQHSPDYVLINTFDVEELPGADDKVRELLEKGSEEGAWPVEMEFARVEVLDRCVYRTDAELDGGGDASDWFDLQACFL